MKKLMLAVLVAGSLAASAIQVQAGCPEGRERSLYCAIIGWWDDLIETSLI